MRVCLQVFFSTARFCGCTEESVMHLLNYPFVVLAFSFLLLWIAAWTGGQISHRRRALLEADRPDFGVVLAASMTLLGLIIGFSFSMATTRYDLRKNYEEAEANAIGTEYVRAELLPAGDAATVRAQLRKYTELRILFYSTRRGAELGRINADTAQLQAQMWSAVETPALAQPTPVIALAV